MQFKNTAKSIFFQFEEVNIGKMKKEILMLNKTNTSQKVNIPTRIIKEDIDIFAEILCTSINNTVKSANFPSSLKLADVTPVHKKERKGQ